MLWPLRANLVSFMKTEQETMQVEETLRDRVMETIKTVYDPEIPVDIYELGLIYEVSVYPINNVFVKMTIVRHSFWTTQIQFTLLLL